MKVRQVHQKNKQLHQVQMQQSQHQQELDIYLMDGLLQQQAEKRLQH